MSGKDEDWGLDGAPAGCGLHKCESESENDGEHRLIGSKKADWIRVMTTILSLTVWQAGSAAAHPG